MFVCLVNNSFAFVKKFKMSPYSLQNINKLGDVIAHLGADEIKINLGIARNGGSSL
jgi:hypothetical protein